MKMNTTTREMLPYLLRTGQFVGVTFKKKDGTFRKLAGRTGVSKHTTGQGLNFDPAAKGMIVMWERNKANRKGDKDKGYRFVKLDRVIEVRANHQVYTVVGNG
jgi:hypothetical protein